MALAAASALTVTGTRSAAASSPAPILLDPAVAGTSPLSMAMHVHSSFSEYTGSMDAHLFQATRNAVDVIWWTDHDARMSAHDYRSAVHFTSLTAEKTDGAAWDWTPQTTGSPSSQAGGIVSSPSSPNDPVSGGSLHVAVTGKSGSTVSYGYYADATDADLDYHGSVYGQTLTIDVLPSTVGTAAYLELLLTLSYHPASGGRAAGIYQLAYRIGGPQAPGTRTTSGLTGIVAVPYTAGSWSTVTIVPTTDIAKLWPDLQSEDFASSGITLSAVSTGSPAAGYFDLLQFGRQYVSGNLPLQTQQRLEAAYAVDYPKVTQRQGLEVSLSLPHLNWFGGSITIPDYTGVSGGDNSPEYVTFLTKLVSSIHAAGGLVSYNHPFGTGGGAALSSSAQDDLVSQVAARLLADDVLGCDILEIGYVLRSGVDLAHHIALWDVLSRNARFLTGNGTTDDHIAQNWAGLTNNWVTTAWARSASEADLLAALAAGRAWSSSLGRFTGSLDLVADGTAVMGSATVSTASSRQLQVIASGVPAGGRVQVVAGVVDYTGTTATSSVLATYPASAFSTGSVTMQVVTSSSLFLRTQVVTSGGQLVAVSNPIWLLRQQPPNGIPAPRAG
jgi:hypothetical protein